MLGGHAVLDHLHVDEQGSPFVEVTQVTGIVETTAMGFVAIFRRGFAIEAGGDGFAAAAYAARLPYGNRVIRVVDDLYFR